MESGEHLELVLAAKPLALSSKRQNLLNRRRDTLLTPPNLAFQVTVSLSTTINKNLDTCTDSPPQRALTHMNKLHLILIALVLSFTMTSLTGCEDSKPASMTEGIELSEIEAYEKAQREMESEDMGEMDETVKP